MEKVSSSGCSLPPSSIKSTKAPFTFGGGGWRLWGPLPRLGCEISNFALALNSPALASKETKGGGGTKREGHGMGGGGGREGSRIMSHEFSLKPGHRDPRCQSAELGIPRPSTPHLHLHVELGGWGTEKVTAPLRAADDGRGLGLRGMPGPQNPHPEGRTRRKKGVFPGHGPIPIPFRIV